MPKQTVMWTALPNGVVGDGANRRLRLSVFVSPRLEASAAEGDTLKLFDDFLNWPARIKDATFSVAFASGPTVAATVVKTAPLDSNMWKALFKSTTFVRPHQFDDLSQSLIISYPVSQTLNSLKQTYQQIGLESPGSLPPTNDGEGDLNSFLSDFAVPWGRDLQERTREQLRQEQQAPTHGDDGSTDIPPPGDDGDSSPPPIHLRASSSLAQAAGAAPSQQQLLSRVLLFHQVPVEPVPTVQPPPPPLPKTADDFKRYVDFHQALASLGAYPELMRRLGMVIDLEIPAASIPTAPPVEAVWVIPNWQPKNPTISSDVSPRTACVWDGTRFAAQPNNGLADRMLPLGDQDYDLVQVDVDGMALKAVNFGANMEQAGDELPDTAGLPALRTAGVSVVQDGRAVGLHQKFLGAKAHNDNLVASNDVLLHAEDLVRGYAVDIWESLSAQWRSLCQRVGTYEFVGTGIKKTIEDEGFVQLGMTKAAPDPSAPPPSNPDLYMHESLFRWEGWSLVAPRPGKALNRDGDPESALETDPTVSQPITPFKLVTAFAPAKRSLPRLRFGAHYRARARAVDLAGNRIALADAPDTAALPASPTAFTYLRFEPVGAPVVALRFPLSEAATPGESLERIVIRSRNITPNRDNDETDAASERTIAPPRSSELICEVHGMFDDSHGHVRTDSDTYKSIRDRDAAPFPPNQNPGDGKQVTPSKLVVPYLPDPLARGAAFRDLPGAPESTLGQIDEHGKLRFIPLPDLKVRDGSAALLDFGDSDDWPKAPALRLILREGDDAPEWKESDRSLRIDLPKAEVATVQLSSYVFKEDLKLLGVWQWLREYIEQRTQELANSPDALEELTQQVALLTQLAEEGGHWMLTPPRALTLVHAVQQPLGRPAFARLTATREPGATAAALLGELGIHLKSTIKIELPAVWQEPIDALDEPGPRVLDGAGHAEDVPVTPNEFNQMIFVNNRTLATYAPTTDSLLFDASGHPTHAFGDTKHRMVRYRAVATSRFREYFPPDAPGGFTRTSNEIVVDVPSSARPDIPQVQYVLPTYGWRRQTDTNLIASQRLGGGLRVYLDRPWFSSGEGELLGVVLFRDVIPDDRREDLKPYVTMWGIDPIRRSAWIAHQPATSSFGNAAEYGFDLSLPELPELPGVTKHVNVAGYAVEYDPDRKLWFSDIQIDAGRTYSPFIRLALARYQPHAVAGAELSRVVVADFMQVAPDRSVIVTYDPYNQGQLSVLVSGHSYTATADAAGNPQNGGSVAEVSVQRRRVDLADDLGWEAAPAELVTVTADQTQTSENILWRGHVTLPQDRAPRQFRLVIKEFEQLLTDGTDLAGPIPATRLVYADTIDLD